MTQDDRIEDKRRTGDDRTWTGCTEQARGQDSGRTSQAGHADTTCTTRQKIGQEGTGQDRG